MTEITAFNHVNVELMCRVCSKSGDEVRLATFNEINAIRKLNLQKFFYYVDAVHLCVYCSALVRKFNRFVAQCEKVNQFFDQHFGERPSPSIQLSTTPTSCYDFSPNIDETKWPIDEKKENCTDSNYFQIEKETENTDSNYYLEIDLRNELLKNDISDDDVPLATFNDTDASEENAIKKKKKVKNKYVKSGDVKGENLNIDLESWNTGVKPKIVKGKKSSEFSSRMVSETEEYHVIKLSKEQVLKEIKEKISQLKYLDSKYKCERCAKGFNFEDVYGKHMEKHQAKKGHLLCDICEMYCPTMVSLRGHMKSHTTRYKCKVCGCVRAGRQHLLEHFSLSHSAERRQYKCDQCSFVSDKRTTMSRHSRSHKPSEGHACEICAKLCRTEEALRVHRLRHDRSSQLSCPSCLKRFLHRSELTRHVAAAHVRKDHYCVECDRYFNTADNLKQHFKRSKTHRDPSIFSCRACPKQFSSQADLTSHMQDHLKSNIRYECAQCGRSYALRAGLRAHTRRAHGGNDDIYPCSLCDKVFKSKYALTRHRRGACGGDGGGGGGGRGGGDRPHACALCARRYSRPALLDSHVARAHTLKNESLQPPCNEEHKAEEQFAIPDRNSTTVLPE